MITKTCSYIFIGGIPALALLLSLHILPVQAADLTGITNTDVSLFYNHLILGVKVLGGILFGLFLLFSASKLVVRLINAIIAAASH